MRVACSVDPLVGGGGVDHLESSASALVKDCLGIQALVLIVTVRSHAGTERLDVLGALLDQDVLAGRSLVFSREAGRKVSGFRGTYMMTRSSVRVDFRLVPPNMCTMFSIGMFVD